MAVYWPISALLVFEKLVYCFRFLVLALLPGLLLQHTLHASVCFAGCKHSNPSVLVAGKWHSRTEILANTSTHLEKKQKQKKAASEKQWNLFCHLHCCYTTDWKHPLLLLLLVQLANVYWFDLNVSVNHTYQEPPSQASALAKYAKVKFTQNIIALWYDITHSQPTVPHRLTLWR